MKFRPHRELLDEAMAEVVELEPTLACLRKRVADTHDWLPEGWTLEIRPYGYDERVGWHTNIVSIRGYGVVGFTDELPNEVVK
jgi:hypothetical protein